MHRRRASVQLMLETFLTELVDHHSQYSTQLFARSHRTENLIRNYNLVTFILIRQSFCQGKRLCMKFTN